MAYNKDFKPLRLEGCDTCKANNMQAKRACPLVPKKERWTLTKKPLVWKGYCPIMGAEKASPVMNLMLTAKDGYLPRAGGLADQPSAFVAAWEVFRPCTLIAEGESVDRMGKDNG